MKGIWNLLITILFLALFAPGLIWLMHTGRLVYALPAGDFGLLSLAIFRLIHLFSYDGVTEPLRSWLARHPEGTFFATLGELIACPWCIGLWISAITVFLYLATPYAYPVLLILALAAVASFIQVLANLIGWYAEGKKQKVEEVEDVPHP